MIMMMKMKMIMIMTTTTTMMMMMMTMMLMMLMVMVVVMMVMMMFNDDRTNDKYDNSSVNDGLRIILESPHHYHVSSKLVSSITSRLVSCISR